MGHALFQFDYAPDKNPYATLLELGPVPAFYRDLASRPPGSITLIETPSRLISNYFPDAWYQAIHRQNIKYALAAPVCGGEADEFPYTATGTAFRRIARARRFARRRDVGRRLSRAAPHAVVGTAGTRAGHGRTWLQCAAKVTARLGEPVYRDEQIAVFSLKKN